MKVAVLLGGKSAEREISFKTGESISSALINKGYEVKKIDTAEEDFISKIKRYNPHVVFIALHGKYGEDGTIQGLLEIMGFPYTGSGVLTSALAMNKIYTKKILRDAKIPTPNFATYTEKFFRENSKIVVEQIMENFSLPFVIKAPNQGSTIGIYFVEKEENIYDNLLAAFELEKEILIEDFITGKEITVSIMGNNNLEILPIIEIISHTGVYDYKAKYTVGLSEHIIPARITDTISAKVKDLAAKSYKELGCEGFARVDFILKEDYLPYVLEINTIPGMTETSLFPDAARNIGMSLEDLAEKILLYAINK